MSWVLRNSLASLGQISAAVGQIAAGNLTAAELRANTRDEIGDIARSFNQMVVNLRELIRQVTGSAQTVASAVEGSSLASGAGKALQEILAMVDQTTREVESITAAAQQIAASSREVVKSVESVAAISEENAAAAEEVSASVQQMNASMEEISASAQSLEQIVRELQAQVARFRV